MAPKQPNVIKRTVSVPVTAGSTGASGSSRPAKRQKTSHGRGIGAKGIGDDTSRMIANHIAAEHAGEGRNYLSTRPSPVRRVRSLLDISLRVSAEGLLKTISIRPKTPAGGGPGSIQASREDDPEISKEMTALREYVAGLPTGVANRLFAAVVQLSAQQLAASQQSARDGSGGDIGVLALARLFFHDAVTKVSLSALPTPNLLLNKIPQCTSLVSLDLSSHSSVKDSALKSVLSKLSKLQTLVLRGCTSVGNDSVIEIAKAAKHNLREVNLTRTAVTIKGLTALLMLCPMLEVLKLANVQGLTERNVTQWITDSIASALLRNTVPLLHLRSLKLRSTEITDSSLGRLLTLCAPTLQTLDISYTSIKSLDLLSQALHSAPTWQLQKLVASGLPLAPASLVGFFTPLSFRPKEERDLFKTLKLGSIPAVSTKVPGLTDQVLGSLLPLWETLEGLENVSLYQNWSLGKDKLTLTRFLAGVGRRCKTLDLTLSLQNHHLVGLMPRDWLLWQGYDFPVTIDDGPPRLEILVLDSSKIDDAASEAVSQCTSLTALHVAETRISTKFLSDVLSSCLHLESLNLTSCRGVPIGQRRSFFDAWARGEVEVEN